MQIKMDDAFWKIGVQFLQKINVENKVVATELLNELEKSANSGIGLHIGINETKEVFIETRAEKMNTFYIPIFNYINMHFLKKRRNLIQLLKAI